MLGIHITIQRDIVSNLIVPMCAGHDYIPLPPFPPTPPPLPASNPWAGPAMAIESICNAWWPPGYAMGANKFTTTVVHQGMTICLDGHDCGNFIPHLQVAPAPNNTLTLLHIPFSKRKANFSASTVKMDKKPTCTMSWPITPMTFCANPVSNPAGAMAVTPIFVNNVKVGMSFLDFLAGFIAIAIDLVIDLIFRKSSSSFQDDAAKMALQSQAGRSVAQMLAGKFVESGMENLAEWAVKQGAASASQSIRALLTGTGVAGLKVEVGTPFFKIEGQAGYNVESGQMEAEASGRAATASGKVGTEGAEIGNNTFTSSETHTHKWGEGTESTQTDISPTEGFRNQTTTTSADGTTSTVDTGGRQSSPGTPL